METKKTIKELADELGISKQAVRKYFNKLPSTMIPTTEKGKYILTLDIQDFIRSKASTVNSTKTPTVDKLVDTLKDEFIADKDNQITDLKVQNDDLRKLLAQHHQLHLKTQQRLEEKTLLLEKVQKKRWWQIWTN